MDYDKKWLNKMIKLSKAAILKRMHTPIIVNTNKGIAKGILYMEYNKHHDEMNFYLLHKNISKLMMGSTPSGDVEWRTGEYNKSWILGTIYDMSSSDMTYSYVEKEVALLNPITMMPRCLIKPINK